MKENYPNGKKILWEKEKLLIMSYFSFSHSVFKRLVLQTRKNQGLFGKGLKLLKTENLRKVVIRIFSIFHNIFYFFKTGFIISDIFHLSSEKLFQFRPVKNSFWQIFNKKKAKMSINDSTEPWDLQNIVIGFL